MKFQKTLCDDCEFEKKCKIIKHWQKRIDNVNAEISDLSNERAELIVQIESEKAQIKCKIKESKFN